MTIALPGSSKLSLAGLIGRKRRDATKSTTKTATKQLRPEEVAKLFTQDPNMVEEPKGPAKLNDKERRDRARLNSLRGALYSKD